MPNTFDYDTADIDACARSFIAAAQQEIGSRCELVDAENSRRRAAAGGDDFPCALPDQCDANQVFLDGLDPFGFDFDGSQRCIDFVNAVWLRARSLGFWSPVGSGNGPEKYAECAAARIAREAVPRIEIGIKGGTVWAVHSSAPLPVYVIDHDCGEREHQNDARHDGEPIHVERLDSIPLPVPDTAPAPVLAAKTHSLSPRDVSTILAALRHWQETCDDVPDSDHDTSAAPLDHFPLGHDAIDDLCERLDCVD